MNPEQINTVHVGAYVDNIDLPVSERRICLQTVDGYILGIEEIRHDDTQHFRLGQRSAGFVALSKQKLELIVVHPGQPKTHPLKTLPITDSNDLISIAKGISDFKRYAIGVRYDETTLELPAPVNYDQIKR